MNLLHIGSKSYDMKYSIVTAMDLANYLYHYLIPVLYNCCQLCRIEQDCSAMQSKTFG